MTETVTPNNNGKEIITVRERIFLYIILHNMCVFNWLSSINLSPCFLHWVPHKIHHIKLLGLITNIVNLILTVPYIHEFYVLFPATWCLQIKCLPKVSLYILINIHNRNNQTTSALHRDFLLKLLWLCLILKVDLWRTLHILIYYD